MERSPPVLLGMQISTFIFLFTFHTDNCYFFHCVKIFYMHISNSVIYRVKVIFFSKVKIAPYHSKTILKFNFFMSSLYFLLRNHCSSKPHPPFQLANFGNINANFVHVIFSLTRIQVNQ